MLEKVLHCFSKYRHIYEYIGTDKKSWDEIKWHLVNVLDVSESTARAQMNVALAKENEVVIEEDGLYRLNRELLQLLINYFVPLYPVRLRVFTQKKWYETNQEIVKWIKEFLKEAYKSTKQSEYKPTNYETVRINLFNGVTVASKDLFFDEDDMKSETLRFVDCVFVV